MAYRCVPSLDVDGHCQTYLKCLCDNLFHSVSGNSETRHTVRATTHMKYMQSLDDILT